MSETFVYTSVFKVREGKLEEYRAFTQRVAQLVQEQEPAMVHFGIYINPQSGEATTVQVHRWVENFARHMDLITPMMGDARELIDLSEMIIRICGGPTGPILDQMWSMAGSGASVSISELAAGARSSWLARVRRNNPSPLARRCDDRGDPPYRWADENGESHLTDLDLDLDLDLDFEPANLLPPAPPVLLTAAWPAVGYHFARVPALARQPGTQRRDVELVLHLAGSGSVQASDGSTRALGPWHGSWQRTSPGAVYHGGDGTGGDVGDHRHSP